MKYTIYGKKNCPFCVKAKTLLGMIQADFEYIDIEEYPEYQQLFQEQGWRTVPQIIHNDEYIGGFTDLQAYLKKKS